MLLPDVESLEERKRDITDCFDRFASPGVRSTHAAHLAFTHPGSGERMEFDMPLPDDLMVVLDQLGPVHRN